MNKFRSRPASALLIVLGMMAFILVSALAFSAYMRSARLPSSYLRRTSASRLLVKAALARAIETVDRSIADYPHPGVPNTGNNIWRNRVMFGQTTNSVTVADTVSPLTLEGLAYIPTPLVNDVRYYSRLSPTCTWQALGFDSGRFSFCAVDVSDYFDLNRVTSSSPRSSATNQRVSFAYLFENEDHTDAEAGSKQWDKMMDDYRELDKDTLEVSYDSKYPLISWADFNLALGTRGALGSIRSPFYDYAMEKGGDTRFYGGGGAKERDLFRRMTFVTDSVNSGSEDDDTTDDDDANNKNAAAVEKYNILDPANQPFPMDTLMADRLGVSEAIIGTSMNSGKAKGEYLQKLSGLGCAALRDYLDPDHYPSSLAVPTTERTPMIAGFRTLFQGSKLAVEKKYAVNEADQGDSSVNDDVEVLPNPTDTTRIVQKTVKYYLASGDLIAGGKAGVVSPLVVFPFNHPDENDKQSYAVGGRFSLFWTNKRQPLRTDNVDPNFLCLKSSADKKFNEQTEYNQEVSLCNIKLQDATFSLPKNIEKAEDALQQLSLRFSGADSLANKMSLDNRNLLLAVTYKWQQTAKKEGNLGGVDALVWTPTFTTLVNNNTLGSVAEIAKATSEMRLMDTQGNAVRLGANGDMTEFVQKGQEQVLYLNSALWLWVKDGSRFVDLVPACLYDDQIVNPQVNDMALRQLYNQQSKKYLGEVYPLMKLPLDGGNEFEFKFSLANLEALVSTPRDIKSELSAMVCDPRFNYAPEHWFTVGSLDEKSWLQNCGAPSAGQGEEDKDIFLATSDAGYLQSKYELAMLPRLTNLMGRGNRLETGNLAQFGTDRCQIPNGQGDAVNQSFMWSHYDPFDTDLAAFDELKLESRGPGLKVNPYSDSTNVLMAAFGNTPIDWKRASTNKVSGTSECAGDFQGQAEDFNKNYAWNEIGPDATCIKWSDLEAIAGRFSRDTRAKHNWIAAFEDMGWHTDDSDHLCGVELDDETAPIWSVDRRFLYGYWHECFGIKQQLFLIFVRAEPMMMGGGASGQIPPQLGARAVALVWRDPHRGKESNAPHRTRVLFYRQFD